VEHGKGNVGVVHNATKVVQKLKCISKNYDKVTTIDNQSWLSIHVYVIKEWRRFPNLLNLYRIVDETIVDNLTSLTVQKS
jgi:hypothetical protein